jgi:hypothetical protein
MTARRPALADIAANCLLFDQTASPVSGKGEQMSLIV